MNLVIIAAIAVLNTLVTFLALAGIGRLVVEGRGRYEEFHGAVRLGIYAYEGLSEKLDNALSCLVTTDARLDEATNPAESGSRAGLFPVVFPSQIASL